MDESISSLSGEAGTCRICRSEGTPEEPLFHPCRCSGSIRNVHQECLVEWLSHSQKKHCELCKTPFRFTKLYDAEMPALLPWSVFTKRAIIHTINGTFRAIRALLVVTIWMIILPWIIRWAWRWMFWFADAGWARDIYLRELRKTSPDSFTSANLTTGGNATWNDREVTGALQEAVEVENITHRILFGYAFKFLVSIGIETFANTSHFDAPHPWKQSDASVFSSLSYISALTPYPPINRILLDIFEGQLITCTVILAFILVFLIREWVVQQQPIVNLDQLREQREQAEIARRRLELLEQARRTLEELEASTASMYDALDQEIDAGSSNAPELVNGELRRPRMPERDASSRAIRVQRLIEEADAILGSQDSPESDGEPGPSTANAERTTTVPPARAIPVFAELPITNAGPDARLNIRRKVKSKAAVVPAAPNTDHPVISNEELQNRLSAITSDEDVTSSQIPQPTEGSATESGPQESEAAEEQQPEVVAEPVQQPEVQLDVVHDEDPVPEPDDLDVDLEEDAERRPEELLTQSLFEALEDWFWGDIQPNTNVEAHAPADEPALLADGEAHEAQFVPIVNGVILPNNAQRPHDPEVVAAAQQAGLNPEAVEEAEDIEGILELIGLQGPLAGLLQTSLFCLLLVVCTVAGAVVLPYIWGKFVLIMVDQPLLLPIGILRVISGLGSFLIDVSILLGSWLLTIGAISLEAVLGVLRTVSSNPYLDGHLITKVSQSALAEANASGSRIYAIFAGKDGLDPLDINAAFLRASVVSHVGLNNLQADINTVLGFFASALRKVFGLLILGKFTETRDEVFQLAKAIPAIPESLSNILWPYLDTATDIFTGLRHGTITLPASNNTGTFDPALTYWSSTDRTLAVCSGYASVACLAAIYVAADTAITRDWQKTEKIIRDSLRQAGGVFKVILIISIEMLAFPFYCGMLLDFAFLPLFANANITSRVVFASSAPYIFCFVHWFIGTCYMFHFALFVGMCRKILRKGVLWFIRDPDDPTFHPVRDVLERNVTTQLRKIAFSALVYGALVILCLGGVIWGIGQLFRGIFPIYWTATEPTVEFPVDLLLFNFVTPLVIRLFKPSDIIHDMYAWWLRKCARMLRLSHFLFDDRKTDEEGQSQHKTWSGLLRFLETPSTGEVSKVTEVKPHEEPGFTEDGQYVLTPCNDQYRPPKPGEAFLHVEDDDVYIADKDGKRNESFARVYIPPLFKTRVTMFMVCLWIFSAFAGLCATLLPLVLGRRLLISAVPGVRFNDIYAYSIGAYILGGLVILARQGRHVVQRLQSNIAVATITSILDTARSQTVRIARVAYFYAFVFVGLPLLLGIILEAHIMIPLHTYFSLSEGGKLQLVPLLESTVGSSLNATLPTHSVGAASNGTSPLFPHTIHIFQDLALGVLMSKILIRALLSDPTSRASEVARRIKRNGRRNPDVGLFTRYVVMPAIILASIILLGPLLTAGFFHGCIYATGLEISIPHLPLLYRFSYPAMSITLILAVVLRELDKATARWRARVRDEVYLVGERLHNFGEKRPPIGSRSIMRRDAPLRA